ncbi:MAG: ketopantoate reductase family protein [Candidatus Hydrogenedentes bacterium]|nr:ketopantoate reductase family protein [Candidatus Hydrogenedentota bacterium]
MKVAIIGPGAMGCLFAARLTRAGIRTFLVDYQNDRAARLNENGVWIEEEGGVWTTKPEVMTSVPPGVNLVIVMTKAYATGRLRFPPDVPILTLQNGLGNVETLCSMVGSARVLVGVTSEGSTLLGEGRVRHAGVGTTRLGAWTSSDPEPPVAALRKAGFDVEATEAPGQLVWEKVAINAAINPITAILNVPNGTILDIREARQLMRDLVVEAAKVASTEGYRFGQSLIEAAEDVCRATASNISSMLQDVRAGKPTEIDAISGEILRRAQLASLPAPRTRVIYQLVRGLEHH